MMNHSTPDGDLVIEQKTLFRQVGWMRQSGVFYPVNHDPSQVERGGYAPVYQEIAIWFPNEGWKE